MSTDRRSAVIIGGLFILASASAILAVPLYDPIINGENYLVEGAGHRGQVIRGALSDLVLAVWLIAKGFSVTAVAATPAGAEASGQMAAHPA
jgi:hypothetical protein